MSSNEFTLLIQRIVKIVTLLSVDFKLLEIIQYPLVYVIMHFDINYLSSSKNEISMIRAVCASNLVTFV